MYIHNDITYKEREDLQHKHIEVTWIEITYPNAKPILVGTVYRPPDSLVEWYNDFIEMYDHAYAEEKEIIILGT